MNKYSKDYIILFIDKMSGQRALRLLLAAVNRNSGFCSNEIGETIENEIFATSSPKALLKLIAGCRETMLAAEIWCELVFDKTDFSDEEMESLIYMSFRVFDDVLGVIERVLVA